MDFVHTRDVKAEAVRFLWKRKHFEERSWKQKQTWKHLTFRRARSGSIFHKTWGKDVEAEANSEVINFDRPFQHTPS